MKQTYKFKIYNSRRNHKLEKLLYTSCSVYNHCVALQKRFYKLFKKNIPMFTLSKHLTKMKKVSRFLFWNKLNSQTIQDISERVCRNYKSFFNSYLKNSKARPPRFYSKFKYSSFTYKQCGYKFEDNVLILQKKYRIKFSKSREIEGKIKTVTIKRNHLGDWYLYVVCDVETNEVLFRQGEAIGLDFGLKHFLTVSNGEKIDCPLFFKQMRNLIRKLNRERSCKLGERKSEKKSNNWLKANLKLQKAYERLCNLRDDFQWKLALQLCSKYSIICTEDLNLKGMQKLWGRKIGELRFAIFMEKLEYIAKRCGCQLVKIDKWFASSQICSDCGYKNGITKDLKVRKWTCPNCGEIHDRDVNASVNILQEGLRMLAVV